MCLLREMEDHYVHPKSKSNHGSLSGNGYEMKNPGHEVCDRDSSSESDRSHPEASAVSESSLDEHTSTQSDNDEDHGKDNQDTLKPVLSLGKEGSAFLAPKIDYNPSFAYIPYTADAYYGGVGVLTGYAPHTIVHSPLTFQFLSFWPHSASKHQTFRVTRSYNGFCDTFAVIFIAERDRP
ncbi:Nuclear transcription factor Y subunit A-8 [Zea mays]|uniref:Nuclear transcription factor Y subunit A-8 n=1 Tax=Zea mays TaxID=4577 RepID=A0A1D6IJ96_MAIZE|nr:Nuclear transcription factor Y subunit A-8 [Zea mays]